MLNVLLTGIAGAGLAGLIIVPLALVALLYEGWAFSCLWRWFAVPLGVPMVSMFQAAGLIGLLNLLRGEKPKEKKEEKPGEGIAATIGILIAPAVLVFVGWIIQHWV